MINHNSYAKKSAAKRGTYISKNWGYGSTKNVGFNPGPEFIKTAIAEFLAKGGKIKPLEANESKSN